MSIGLRRRRRRGAGRACAPKIRKKRIFEQLSSKIRAFSGKHRVQLGHFVNFSGALKMQDMKMQDLKLTDQCAGNEIAGHEIAGHAKAKQKTSSNV